jgi:GTP-binding protein
MFIVSIVGKPNVGKSTLFNRIFRQRLAIVDDKPGVTRDRIYANCEWLTREFTLIDTGGLTLKELPLQKEIDMQAQFAIEESNLIIFVCSAKDGIDHDDFFVAKKLKSVSKGKKIVLVASKSDAKQNPFFEKDVFRLGLGEPLYIGTEHGIGIGELLDKVISFVDIESKKDEVKPYISFCVLGRPNVGKSSLVNTILGEQRMIVSDIAGTTRDAIDSDFKNNKKLYRIIDTAGIRRKGKIFEDVEKYSVLKAQLSLQRSDICLLVIDGKEGVQEQDETVAGLIYEANMPAMIIVNKWDAVEKDSLTMPAMEKAIREKFQFLPWAPIVFVSALNNQRIEKIFENFDKILGNMNKKISTSLLNEVVLKAQSMNLPPVFKGGRIDIDYATQATSKLPVFVIFCNNPEFLHFSYARYIENNIRTAFGLDNLPITLYFKPKNSRERGTVHE